MKKNDLVYPTLLKQTSEEEYRLPFPGELQNPIQNYITSSMGLSKRELFASMAMQGILADPNCGNPISIASLAVECADALIEELNKE